MRTVLDLERLEERDCPSTADIFTMNAPVYDHGGPTLSNPKIYNVYANGAPNMDALTQVIVGDYGEAIKAVYGVGTGTFAGSTTLPDPGPLSSSQIGAWLQNAIKTGQVPKGYDYMLYLNTGPSDKGPNVSGYHTSLDDGTPYVVEWVGTDAYVPTHEYTEMVTDPYANAYYADPSPDGGEIADLAYPNIIQLDGYNVAALAAPIGYQLPQPPPPPNPMLMWEELISIPTEELDSLAYSLLSNFNSAYSGPAQQAQSAMTSNPMVNTYEGQIMILYGEAAFASALQSR